MTNDKPEKPTIEVVDGILTIKIPVELLKFALNNSPNLCGLIIDDINPLLDYIQKNFFEYGESEDVGKFFLMLEEMTDSAYEDGVDGIINPEDEI
jgi:hypothetical protein